MLSRVVFLLFCFEVGLVLLVLPWTLLWDNNHFFSLKPDLNYFLLSNYLRGGVSGIGLINLALGFSELSVIWRRR